MIITLIILIIIIKFYLKDIKLRSVYEKDFVMVMNGDHYLVSRISFPRFKAKYYLELTDLDITDSCSRKEMDEALRELDIYMESI